MKSTNYTLVEGGYSQWEFSKYTLVPGVFTHLNPTNCLTDSMGKLLPTLQMDVVPDFEKPIDAKLVVIVDNSIQGQHAKLIQSMKAIIYFDDCKIDDLKFATTFTHLYITESLFTAHIKYIPLPNLTILKIEHSQVNDQLLQKLITCFPIKITEISLFGNFITNASQPALSDYISKLSLQNLNLGCNQLVDVTKICTALKKSPKLRLLNLYNCRLNNSNIIPLQGLFKAAEITSFSIGGNNDIDENAILASLVNYKCLQELDISKPCYMSKELKELSIIALQHIAQTSLLTSLSISSCIVKNLPNPIKELKVTYFKNLIYMGLGHCHLGKELFDMIASSIEYATYLQSLILSENGIDSSSATLLAKSLISCTDLRAFNISDNNIGPIGALDIGNSLKMLAHLELLNVAGNQIEDKGMCAISDGLKCIKTLKLINAGYNSISKADSLQNAFSSNSGISYVYLEGNLLDDAECKNLNTMLKMSNKIVLITLRSNKVVDTKVLKGMLEYRDACIDYIDV